MSVDTQSEPSLNFPAAVFSRQDKPVRVRFSPKERIRIIEYLDLTGHKCALCPATVNLEIDHKNGLQANRLTDYRWLCKSCNLSQRGLTDTSRLGCVCAPEDHAETEMERNLRTEPAWVEFVQAQLAYGPVPKDDLTGNSAYQIGLSVATVNRHWKKYACPLGPFQTYRPDQGTRILVRLRK